MEQDEVKTHLLTTWLRAYKVARLCCSLAVLKISRSLWVEGFGIRATR